MIYKHIGIVKEISRVGLPGFQSKDRVEAGLTSLLISPLRGLEIEDERSNSGGRRKKNLKTLRQFVRQTQTKTQRKTQVLVFFIWFIYRSF
jgi:hypothetical protein